MLMQLELMPVELIAFWSCLALLSCAAVCAYVWQRHSDDTPRADLNVDNGREVALFSLFSWRY